MSLFDFVKNAVSILDVVNSYVSLKRIGGYYKGTCPIHSEKDASFTVSPDKNIFYCFGCQAGGDVIAFIAQVEHLTQGQAVHYLVERYQLNIPEELQKETHQYGDPSKRESLFNVAKIFAQWTHHLLLKNETAQKYLLQRSITKKTIEQFELGFFPGGVTGTQQLIKAMRNQNVLIDDLVTLGILAEGQNNYYSPFEDRILFPIKDHVGRYCAFGGRVFLPHDDRARYYNSKESDIFSKRLLLYGFEQARRTAQQTGIMYLVEGYMDCIAMVQSGYENTVATLGTACSTEHLKALSRFAHTIVIMYDGDKAGQNASEKVIELCWDVDLTLQVVPLPLNEDPASLLASSASFKELIDKKEDIFTFLVKKQSEDFFEKNMAEKLQICQRLVSMIEKIPHRLKQHFLLEQASIALQIPFAVLKKMMQHKQPQLEQKSDEKLSAEKKDKTGLRQLEKKIIGYFLLADQSQPNYLTRYQEIDEILSTHAKRIIKLWHQYGKNDISEFTKTLEEKEQKWVLSICMEYDQTMADEIIETFFLEYKKRVWKLKINRLKDDLALAKNEGNIEQINNLMKFFLTLKNQMQSKGIV